MTAGTRVWDLAVAYSPLFRISDSLLRACGLLFAGRLAVVDLFGDTFEVAGDLA